MYALCWIYGLRFTIKTLEKLRLGAFDSIINQIYLQDSIIDQTEVRVHQQITWTVIA